MKENITAFQRQRQTYDTRLLHLDQIMTRTEKLIGSRIIIRCMNRRSRFTLERGLRQLRFWYYQYLADHIKDLSLREKMMIRLINSYCKLKCRKSYTKWKVFMLSARTDSTIEEYEGRMSQLSLDAQRKQIVSLLNSVLQIANRCHASRKHSAFMSIQRCSFTNQAARFVMYSHMRGMIRLCIRRERFFVKRALTRFKSLMDVYKQQDYKEYIIDQLDRERARNAYGSRRSGCILLFEILSSKVKQRLHLGLFQVYYSIHAEVHRVNRFLRAVNKADGLAKLFTSESLSKGFSRWFRAVQHDKAFAVVERARFERVKEKIKLTFFNTQLRAFVGWKQVTLESNQHNDSSSVLNKRRIFSAWKNTVSRRTRVIQTLKHVFANCAIQHSIHLSASLQRWKGNLAAIAERTQSRKLALFTLNQWMTRSDTRLKMRFFSMVGRSSLRQQASNLYLSHRYNLCSSILKKRTEKSLREFVNRWRVTVSVDRSNDTVFGLQLVVQRLTEKLDKVAKTNAGSLLEKFACRFKSAALATWFGCWVNILQMERKQFATTMHRTASIFYKCFSARFRSLFKASILVNARSTVRLYEKKMLELTVSSHSLNGHVKAHKVMRLMTRRLLQEVQPAVRTWKEHMKYMTQRMNRVENACRKFLLLSSKAEIREMNKSLNRLKVYCALRPAALFTGFSLIQKSIQQKRENRERLKRSFVVWVRSDDSVRKSIQHRQSKLATLTKLMALSLHRKESIALSTWQNLVKRARRKTAILQRSFELYRSHVTRSDTRFLAQAFARLQSRFSRAAVSRSSMPAKLLKVCHRIIDSDKNRLFACWTHLSRFAIAQRKKQERQKDVLKRLLISRTSSGRTTLLTALWLLRSYGFTKKVATITSDLRAVNNTQKFARFLSVLRKDYSTTERQALVKWQRSVSNASRKRNLLRRCLAHMEAKTSCQLQAKSFRRWASSLVVEHSDRTKSELQEKLQVARSRLSNLASRQTACNLYMTMKSYALMPLRKAFRTFKERGISKRSMASRGLVEAGSRLNHMLKTKERQRKNRVIKILWRLKSVYRYRMLHSQLEQLDERLSMTGHELSVNRIVSVVSQYRTKQLTSTLHLWTRHLKAKSVMNQLELSTRMRNEQQNLMMQLDESQSRKERAIRGLIAMWGRTLAEKMLKNLRHRLYRWKVSAKLSTANKKMMRMFAIVTRRSVQGWFGRQKQGTVQRFVYYNSLVVDQQNRQIFRHLEAQKALVSTMKYLKFKFAMDKLLQLRRRMGMASLLQRMWMIKVVRANELTKCAFRQLRNVQRSNQRHALLKFAARWRYKSLKTASVQTSDQQQKQAKAALSALHTAMMSAYRSNKLWNLLRLNGSTTARQAIFLWRARVAANKFIDSTQQDIESAHDSWMAQTESDKRQIYAEMDELTTRFQREREMLLLELTTLQNRFATYMSEMDTSLHQSTVENRSLNEMIERLNEERAAAERSYASLQDRFNSSMKTKETANGQAGTATVDRTLYSSSGFHDELTRP
eukprot:GILK01009535.1.p1 GENE.GILK01009535.1~~GILK01009535.1.p1  ORF type:complete len:1645 (-),score=385.93 GILK01009535.1:104-4630(-)